MGTLRKCEKQHSRKDVDDGDREAVRLTVVILVDDQIDIEKIDVDEGKRARERGDDDEPLLARADKARDGVGGEDRGADNEPLHAADSF